MGHIPREGAIEAFLLPIDRIISPFPTRKTCR